VWADVTSGDLREEHAAIAAERGRTIAHAWYWLQALAIAGDRVRDRLTGGATAFRSFFSLGDRPVLTFRREIVRAVRANARQPLVAAAIVLTLALGLGVNAAAYQLVNAFILHPLPGLNVDGLAMLSEQSPTSTYSRESVAPANFYEWRREAKSVTPLAAFDWWEVNLAGGSEPERVLGFQVSGGFFEMFGLVPAAGRFLSEADEAPGAAHVVVMGDKLWKRRFGARLDVVGQPVRIGGENYTVVGIAPEGFVFPNSADVWAPYPHTAENAANRKDRSLTAFGRLAPGATIAQAQQEIQALYTRMRATYSHDNDGLSASVRTLADGMKDDGSPQVVAMIQVAALLVLLIGGMNIANLLIARGWDRQRETAVRLAIGASRSHVLRQFAVESLVLSLPAVPLALGMAWVSLHAMRAAMPARIERFIPGWSQIAVDWRLALVTLVGALVCALLFSVVPALQTSRPALSQALGQGGRTMTGGARRQRFRRALVITEIALALPLLVAAGLSTLAARRLATGPQGFDPSGVLVMRTQLPDAGFADATARRDFNDRLLERVLALPGVLGAGTVNHLPSSDSSSSRPILIDGTTLAPNQPPPMVVYRVISPGYFATMRIPMQRGRDFSNVDRENAQPVAIVSGAMSHQFWPGADPIGRRLQLADAADSPWYTVIGVAGNIIDDWFDRRNAATVYFSMAQRPQYTVELAARTTGDPATFAPDLRRALHEVDPFQPAELLPMTTLVGDRTIGLRMIGAMMAVLGALALVLAAIGIYALMAYYVAQRRQEIGVRLALGASRASVVRMTVSGAGRLALAGLTVGLLLAVALTRVMESALFGTVTAEPALFITITAILAATAVIASLVPARHAASVDPARALRTE
jgi:predicted permease